MDTMIYWILVAILDGQPADLGLMRNKEVCNTVAEALHTHPTNTNQEVVFYCQKRQKI